MKKYIRCFLRGRRTRIVDVLLPEGGTFSNAMVVARVEGGILLDDKYVAWDEIQFALLLEQDGTPMQDFTKRPVN